MTPAQLAAFCPAASPFFDTFASVLPQFGITSPKNVLSFLVQTSHESMGYTHFEENLNYSATGLAATWPSHFWLASDHEPVCPPGKRDANAYAKRPVDIANFVYASRNGNGDEASRDGYAYRGRCPIEVTGRGNYRAVSIALYGDGRLELSPNAVADPKVGILVSAEFWRSHGLNAIGDTGDVAHARAIVNGKQMIGLQHCQALWDRGAPIFGV